MTRRIWAVVVRTKPNTDAPKGTILMNQVIDKSSPLIEMVSEIATDHAGNEYSDALARLGKYLNADIVSLTKLGPGEDQYSVISCWPEHAGTNVALDPWQYDIMLSGETMIRCGFVPQVSGLAGRPIQNDHRNWVRVPIYNSGKVSYCLGLDWTDPPSDPDMNGHLRIVEPAARLIQSMIQSKQVSDILKTVSRRDRLTGLANRSVAVDRLESAMARARRSGAYVSVFHLNIDRFKTINDALGYVNGDYLLKAVSKRIVDIFRETDTTARIGNDDFLVIVESIDCEENLAVSAERISQEFKAPIYIGGQHVHVQLSQGVAVYTRLPGETADGLLKNAEIAMKSAKEVGGNQIKYFSADMNAAAKRRLGLESDLHRALQREEFQVHYQPQLCLESGRITGAESLIRWVHPELGMMPPSEFLWIAEETGLIVPLSEWILSQVCLAASHWHNTVSNDFQVAVNVSPRWFGFPGFPETVEGALSGSKLPPGSLEFEITEDVVLSNTDTTGPLLANLHALGVKLTLDDFGTGYSSLSYLRNLPVGALKIDRSFVSNLEDRKTDAAVVLALITLCKELDIEIVAEGVETAEQLNFLSENQCHLAQGYYISRPQPFDTMNTFIHAYHET